LAGADQEVDLVPSDAEDLGHLLDGVRLQGTPPPLIREIIPGSCAMWVVDQLLGCGGCSSLSRLMDVSAAHTCRRARETRQ
jgi:hypothetical protein